MQQFDHDGREVYYQVSIRFVALVNEFVQLDLVSGELYDAGTGTGT